MPQTPDLLAAADHRKTDCERVLLLNSWLTDELERVDFKYRQQAGSAAKFCSSSGDQFPPLAQPQSVDR